MENIIDYFERTVNRFPKKTAVAYKNTVYTFRELRRLAISLGRRIEERGMVGEPIVVFVNRDADTVVLFMAVLYSGNYYIPVDPDMPEAKIRAILEDCGAQMILYGNENRELVERLSLGGCGLTLADAAKVPVTGRKDRAADGTVTGREDTAADGNVAGREDTAADMSMVGQKVSADAPLYMVYTSGSTGKPKGVLKSHGAVISFITTFAGHFNLGADEIIGNQTPFFFDASAKDLYLMIFTGATMEVLPSELFIFPVTLIEYMNQRQISYVCWVPTALAIVTQMNTFKKLLPETLKKVFFVGEVFPIKQLRKWMQTLPQLQYVNLYGSSEIAGICCYYEIKTLDADTVTLPVGRPLPNCQVFLMDGGRRVTEPDVIGEVYVAGPALALEYYHNPEKTADTFVMLHLPEGKTVRAFKSGDLARYDGEGNLVFVSRKDFQIKHMGRRIELGEIEAVAGTVPEIGRCCCLYDEKRRVIRMFCQVTEGCDWDGRKIQSALRGRLSDYMLPGRVTVMDRLPLNANGKIDRAGLKALL